MAVVLYDDRGARRFEPFALTRPVGELRAGGELIRRRWERRFGVGADGFVAGPHLAAFDEFDAPGASRGTLAAGTVLVNSRCVPHIAGPLVNDAATSRWTCDGQLAAVRLAAPLGIERLNDGRLTLDDLAPPGGMAMSVDGWWLDEVWDLVRHLNAMLAADALALDPGAGAPPAHLTVVGSHAVRVDGAATIEPLVVADATAGPILIRGGALIQAFTRLVGPCIVGEHATVSGGRVAACSIGERCKVNGELSSTILVGHANKGHDGFVGHSIIGRWANLGAGTVTSNLKNSYGSVALWTPDGVRNTSLQFLGSLIGDHVKTGIGTLLTTGTVLGAGANIFGSAMLPKVVPPFAWGESAPWETFAIEKFLEVAERVMARREVALSAEQRTQLAAAFAARWSA